MLSRSYALISCIVEASGTEDLPQPVAAAMKSTDAPRRSLNNDFGVFIFTNINKKLAEIKREYGFEIKHDTLMPENVYLRPAK